MKKSEKLKTQDHERLGEQFSEVRGRLLDLYLDVARSLGKTHPEAVKLKRAFETFGEVRSRLDDLYCARHTIPSPYYNFGTYKKHWDERGGNKELPPEGWL